MSENIIDKIEIIKYKEGDRDIYTGEVIPYPCEIHYRNGLRHRDNDLPAIVGLGEYKNNQKWYENGEQKRSKLDENGYTQYDEINIPLTCFIEHIWTHYCERLSRQVHHRDEIDRLTGKRLPALIRYFSSNNKIIKKYFVIDDIEVSEHV